jgi:hypothetical protein
MGRDELFVPLVIQHNKAAAKGLAKHSAEQQYGSYGFQPGAKIIDAQLSTKNLMMTEAIRGYVYVKAANLDAFLQQKKIVRLGSPFQTCLINPSQSKVKYAKTMLLTGEEKLI